MDSECGLCNGKGQLGRNHTVGKWQSEGESSESESKREGHSFPKDALCLTVCRVFPQLDAAGGYLLLDGEVVVVQSQHRLRGLGRACVPMCLDLSL